MKTLETDNGKQFANFLIKVFCEQKQYQINRGQPRYAQNHEQVERANQTLTRKPGKICTI